jgi:chromosome segregation ATPase
LENTLASHRDAARAETDALRVAVDAAAKANAEAEKSRVLLVEELRRHQTELTNAKAELERCKKNARDAADKTERLKEETRSSRSAFDACERRLKRVVSAMRVVDDAAAHVRAVARGDEDGDVPETAEDIQDRFDKNGEKAFPASLAESLGPTRRARDSRRDDAHIAAAREGASTFPDADPLADSVPASAEAAPVTAPVPQRRGKRQRMVRQK